MIHGMVVVVDVANFEYPELVATSREVAAAQLRHNTGVLDTCEVTWLPDAPFRQERTGRFIEFEGELAEEFVSIECPWDEASHVRLACEVEA